jgi:hypothetical protein
MIMPRLTSNNCQLSPAQNSIEIEIGNRQLFLDLLLVEDGPLQLRSLRGHISGFIKVSPEDSQPKML